MLQLYNYSYLTNTGGTNMSKFIDGATSIFNLHPKVKIPNWNVDTTQSVREKTYEKIRYYAKKNAESEIEKTQQ